MTEDRVFAKCAWRLIPFLTLIYIVSFLDRVNVGFAALTMNKDLVFSPAVYGIGAGVFFLGYGPFQLPANLILNRLGAKRWLFLILASWGVISMANALISGPLSFYALRFLLGLAECGLVPGVLLYLTYWFPLSYRARFSATFLAGSPVAFVIGGPLSAMILQMEGVGGLHGWQWLFILEGVPACVLALFVYRLLPDRPAEAPWLSPEEKAFIVGRLAVDPRMERPSLASVLLDLRVITLGFVNFGVLAGGYGAGLWLPQIIAGMGFTTLATGFLIVLPYSAAVVVMILWGRSSDARNEHIWHIAIPAFIAAAGFAVASVSTSTLLSLIALSFAATGIFASLAPQVSAVSSFLSGPAVAAGIGLMTGIGTTGGLVGPVMTGFLTKDGDYSRAMMGLASALFIASVLALLVGRSLAPRARALTAEPVSSP
jgi:ACS family tartrate transporter-like MFS transporter